MAREQFYYYDSNGEIPPVIPGPRPVEALEPVQQEVSTVSLTEEPVVFDLPPINPLGDSSS